jgi:hypothetical protein
MHICQEYKPNSAYNMEEFSQYACSKLNVTSRITMLKVLLLLVIQNLYIKHIKIVFRSALKLRYTQGREKLQQGLQKQRMAR